MFQFGKMLDPGAIFLFSLYKSSFYCFFSLLFMLLHYNDLRKHYWTIANDFTQFILYCFCFCSFLLMSCKVMERSPLNNRHLLVLCFCYSQSKTWFNAIFLIRYHLTQVIILHWFNVGELDFVHNLAILKLSGL